MYFSHYLALKFPPQIARLMLAELNDPAIPYEPHVPLVQTFSWIRYMKTRRGLREALFWHMLDNLYVNHNGSPPREGCTLLYNLYVLNQMP